MDIDVDLEHGKERRANTVLSSRAIQVYSSRVRDRLSVQILVGRTCLNTPCGCRADRALGEERNAGLSSYSDSAADTPVDGCGDRMLLSYSRGSLNRGTLIRGRVAVVYDLRSNVDRLAVRGWQNVVGEARVGDIADGDRLQVVEEVKAHGGDHSNGAVNIANLGKNTRAHRHLHSRAITESGQCLVGVATIRSEVEAQELPLADKDVEVRNLLVGVKFEDACVGSLSNLCCFSGRSKYLGSHSGIA